MILMRFKKSIIFSLIFSLIFTALPLNLSASPTLKEGHYEKWIDRVDSLPQYATDLYNWMVSNAAEGGALRTAVDETLNNGNSVHFVTEFTGGPYNFTYESGATNEELFEYLAQSFASEISSVTSEISDYIYTVYGAFDRDHPEVFWLSGGISTTWVTSYTLGKIPNTNKAVGYYTTKQYIILKSPTSDIRAASYTSADLIDSEADSLNNRIEEILSGEYPSNGTRKEKVAYFNKVLTKINGFNSSGDLSPIDASCRECISAMYGRTGAMGPVCEAYSRAFKVLCDKVGIPCVLVDGTANSGASVGGHMWNYVQMENGKWYGADVSWNDPSVVGITSADTGYENEKFLLVGSSTVINNLAFIESHPAENSVFSNGLAFTNGPELSVLTYEEDLAAELQSKEYGKIKGVTLTIGNDLSLNYYADITEKYHSAKLRLTQNGITTIVEGIETGNANEFKFTYKGVAPQNMGDNILAELIFDGEVLSVLEEYSIKTYCQKTSAKTNNKLILTFLADILEYGAAAQEFKNYKTNELVNNVSGLIPSEYKTLETTDRVIGERKSETSFINGLGVYCDYKNNIYVNFITNDLSNVAIRVNGVVVSKELFECLNSSTGQYKFMSDAIYATGFNDIYTIELLEDGNVVQTVKYSVKSYIYSMQNQTGSDGSLTALAKISRALYNYGQSAIAYKSSL